MKNYQITYILHTTTLIAYNHHNHLTHYIYTYYLKPFISQILRYPKIVSYRLLTHRRAAHWIFFPESFFLKENLVLR